MSWPADHKQTTRARILDAAADAFGERGVESVGVAEIMRSAGLTHGGFYAHFESKEDRLAAAVSHASAQLDNLIETEAHQLLDAASFYLSPAQRAHPECPIAALGTELAHGNPNVRRALQDGIRSRLKALYNLTSARMRPKARRQQAAGALACMVGGLILARGLNEDEALQLLNDCKVFLREAIASKDVPSQ
jgi:TetR/AcrR family transcriptional repressor of nem operon